MTDFAALIRALVDAEVDFIIVGGVAAVAHGSSRLTQDLDIIYSRETANLARLVQALTPYDPYLRGAPRGLPFSFDLQSLTHGLNFTLTTTIGDIDLFGEIPGGGGFDALRLHVNDLVIFGRPCRCLDLPWLIRTKRAAGRPRDLEVLAELESILEEQMGGDGA